MTYSLTVRYELEEEWLTTLCEMAGHGIDYWAQKAILDEEANTYTVRWEDSGLHTKTVTYGCLTRAVQKILSMPEKVQVSPYYQHQMQACIADPGEVDAIVADIVVQVAVLGKVVYG